MVRGCSRAVDSVTDHAAELLCGEGNSLQVTETIEWSVHMPVLAVGFLHDGILYKLIFRLIFFYFVYEWKSCCSRLV